jgi:hypothetical protein
MKSATPVPTTPSPDPVSYPDTIESQAQAIARRSAELSTAQERC